MDEIYLYTISFFSHCYICASYHLLMLLRIKRIGDFDFARVEKSMPIFETIFINLYLSPNNVIISQLHFLQLNFGLQNITISNFTVRYIRLNPKYII